MQWRAKHKFKPYPILTNNLPTTDLDIGFWFTDGWDCGSSSKSDSNSSVLTASLTDVIVQEGIVTASQMRFDTIHTPPVARALTLNPSL